MTTRFWYRDDSDDNLEEDHLTQPPQYLTLEQLFETTGATLRKVENCEDEEVQAKLRQEVDCKAFGWLNVSHEALGSNYDAELKKYYAEHLHEDIEIRLITAGSSFFELRDYQDRWIRVHVQKGDLIQLPAGMYHRMTLDTDKYVKMLRMFLSNAEWKAMDRPVGDSSPARKAYLASIPNDSSKQ